MIKVILNAPDTLSYRKEAHRDWLKNAVLKTVRLLNRYGIESARNIPEVQDQIDENTLIISPILLWNDNSINRGKGIKIAPNVGIVQIDMASIDFPFGIGLIALENLFFHEVGHILGLEHCEHADCAMTKPEIAGFMAVIIGWLFNGTQYCGSCRKKLRDVGN